MEAIRPHKLLSVRRQCSLLQVPRSSLYYRPVQEKPENVSFMYMVAFIDVYSRKIVGWGISNSMTKKWCLDVLHDAITQNGKPEIINSDQGSQSYQLRMDPLFGGTKHTDIHGWQRKSYRQYLD